MAGEQLCSHALCSHALGVLGLLKSRLWAGTYAGGAAKASRGTEEEDGGSLGPETELAKHSSLKWGLEVV